VLHSIVPPPEFLIQPKNTTAADPFGAHFTCSANGYGRLKINWFSTKFDVQKRLPSKVIISEERTSEKVNSILFIPNVTMEDEGGYFCSAKIRRVSTMSDIAFLEQISKLLLIILEQFAK